MILIPTSIKILRPLGVLPGFMMNQTAKRCEAWNDLWVLIHQSNTPWICAGHFNEITQQGEKLGGALRSHTQEQHFKEVIDKCGFMDLGFIGQHFTWSKHF